MDITDPIINDGDRRRLRELNVDTADNVQTGLLVCMLSTNNICQDYISGFT